MLIKKIINVGIIVSLTVVGVNLYRYLQERGDGKGIVSCSLPTGYFDLLNLDGRLQPVDESTGKVIGFLERRSDGQIQLTTADGFAPNVTPCLSGKLSTEQLHSLPLHE